MVKIYVLLSTVLNTFKSMRAVCRIWDVYPGSGFFPFPDPGSRIPYPKKFVVIPFFWSHKFHKIELFNF